MAPIYLLDPRQSTTIQAVDLIFLKRFSTSPLQFRRTLGWRIILPRYAPALMMPVEESGLMEGAGACDEARMRIGNDYMIAVVWAALLGLVVAAQWLKIPLG